MMGAKVVTHIAAMTLVVVLVTLALSQFMGVRFFSVLSGSMEPELSTGSLVVTAPESLVGAIEKGDVVSYVADENLTVVTHRVVAYDSLQGTYTTQGDANGSEDPPVLKANIVGKVVFSVPFVGYPLSYLSTMTGKIIVVTAALVLVLLIALINLLRQQKPKRRIVITYDDEADLTPETFSRIAQGLQARRGEKP